jgi:hypothetical protein
MLKSVDQSLAAYSDWFVALDGMYGRLEAQAAQYRDQIREKTLLIAKLRSQLAWLESRGAIKFVKRLKGMLP